MFDSFSVNFFLLVKLNIFKGHIKIKLKILKITKPIPTTPTVENWISLIGFEFDITFKLNQTTYIFYV